MILNQDVTSLYSRKLEDYLEAILVFTEKKGYARTKDIAVWLKVTPASVAEMFKKLDKEGLVTYRKYEGVTFTSKGEDVAKSVKRKHEILKEFLEIIHIPRDTADKDACVMEHHLHPKTIQQIKKFVDFVKNAPVSPKWLDHFKEFCKTGKHEYHNKKE